MSLISDNIKILRKRRGLTQEQFSEKVGIKRSLLGAYEEGRADPRLNNLLRMSKLFEVSVDALISTDLTVLSDEEFVRLKEKRVGPHTQVLAITVDNEDKENIELVPDKAAAGYLNGYADPEYIQNLPRFKLPFLPGNSTYRAFEISGDSMLPLESGTIIIGQYVEKPEYIKNGMTYVLVTQKEGVVYKRVFNYIESHGKLYLSSDNPQYSGYEIETNEILEIWEAKAFIGLSFPDPANADDLSLKKLAGIVMDLQKEVVRLKDSQVKNVK
ncbi:MAG TPA: transcriptional regulator [Cytophagales bacterium]|jgi:transcriptional regulator with XRE-family HTH domain|nr:transcriptional regulator [Cytophagales bacterium]